MPMIYSELFSVKHKEIQRGRLGFGFVDTSDFFL